MELVSQARAMAVPLIALALSMSRGGPKGSIVQEAILAALGAIALIPAFFRYFTVRYAIHEGSFILRGGLVFRQTRTIPLERIQNINLKRGMLHQIFRVATLQIETASGAGAEAELAVVGNVEAARLADELQRVTAGTVQEESDVVYRASPRQLFVAGATQNRAGAIVLFFIGLLSYVQDAARDIIVGAVRSGSTFLRFLSAVNVAAAVAIFALVGLLVAGWLLSIVMSFITDYGFTLRSRSGLLRVRHGLFTQIESALPARRVQALRLEEPILQRWIGYCQVFAESAGSYVEKSSGGSAKLAPLLERDRAADTFRLVFPELDLDRTHWRKVSPLTIRRGFVRYLLLGLILTGGVRAGFGNAAFAALPFVAGGAWWLARRRYQILGYAIEDGFLFVRTGIWRQRIVVVPETRVQWSSITQTPFQRRIGLVDLQIMTAGATQNSHLRVVDLSQSTGEELQDLLAQKSSTGGGV